MRQTLILAGLLAAVSFGPAMACSQPEPPIVPNTIDPQDRLNLALVTGKVNEFIRETNLYIACLQREQLQARDRAKLAIVALEKATGKFKD